MIAEINNYRKLPRVIRDFDSYEKLPHFYLVDRQDERPLRVAQHLRAPPWNLGGTKYIPVEYVVTGKRDAVREDLLTSISEMEAITRAMDESGD